MLVKYTYVTIPSGYNDGGLSSLAAQLSTTEENCAYHSNRLRVQLNNTSADTPALDVVQPAIPCSNSYPVTNIKLACGGQEGGYCWQGEGLVNCCAVRVEYKYAFVFSAEHKLTYCIRLQTAQDRQQQVPGGVVQGW